MGPMANTQTGNRTKRRSRRSLAPRLPVRVIVDWDAVAKIDKQALVAQVGSSPGGSRVGALKNNKRGSAMNRLTRKLENFAPLSEDDKRFLDDVTRAPHEVAARTNLVREGDAPDHVHLILDG